MGWRRLERGWKRKDIMGNKGNKGNMENMAIKDIKRLTFRPE